MTEFNRPLVVSALINPEIIKTLNLSQWDLMIRQARRASVLARLGEQLEDKSLLADIPGQVLQHIHSAQFYAEQFRVSLDWEVQCIEKVFAKLNIPVVLLKGAAYAMANNKAAQGRVFSDIDLLVFKTDISKVESAMMLAGWLPGEIDNYDKIYYRKWMHEIPPLQHISRRTTVDIHHNILPETCRFSPDAEKLLKNIVKLHEEERYVLSPVDRVLHSATHLFHEGEFDHGFRDISDLDLLIREFSLQEGFFENLLPRSIELQQQIPLYYALRYTRLILETPIPIEIKSISEKVIIGKMKQVVMDFLFMRALLPDHASCNDRWTGLARWLLYIRSHWLRMPLYLLIPHLMRKGLLRITGKSGH